MASGTMLVLLPVTGFSFTVMANLLFYVAAFIAAALSMMLYYHWFKYGVGVAGTFLVMVLYGVGTLFLLAAGYGLLLAI